MLGVCTYVLRACTCSCHIFVEREKSSTTSRISNSRNHILTGNNNVRLSCHDLLCPGGNGLICTDACLRHCVTRNTVRNTRTHCCLQSRRTINVTINKNNDRNYHWHNQFELLLDHSMWTTNVNNQCEHLMNTIQRANVQTRMKAQ